MENRRGFTLLELLAMLVVLGILMAVTIPNITGILGSQRINVFKADASNLAEKAKIKVSKNVMIGKPALGECYILTLDYLDDNDDFDKGPNGGTYSPYDSFVIYTRESGSDRTTKFTFYVRLVEETDSGRQGIDLVEYADINKIKKDDIKEMDDYGLSETKDSSVANLNNATIKMHIDEKVVCNTFVVDKYFVHQ